MRLKKGMVVMLLRNISIPDGLTNGCRLKVDDVINSRILLATVLSGKSKGQQISLPRTNLSTSTPEEFGFEFTRNTFPIAHAISFSLNKGQGMSLESVGLFFNTQPFAHAQLYIGRSRSTDPQNLHVFIEEKAGRPLLVQNLVFKELLN